MSEREHVNNICIIRRRLVLQHLWLQTQTFSTKWTITVHYVLPCSWNLPQSWTHCNMWQFQHSVL